MSEINDAETAAQDGARGSQVSNTVPLSNTVPHGVPPGAGTGGVARISSRAGGRTVAAVAGVTGVSAVTGAGLVR